MVIHVHVTTRKQNTPNVVIILKGKSYPVVLMITSSHEQSFVLQPVCLLVVARHKSLEGKVVSGRIWKLTSCELEKSFGPQI